MGGKLKLNPNPTFKAKVPIPVPGSAPALVEFTFKHKTRSALVEWLEERKEDDEVGVFREIVASWDLDDEFNDENIRRLCDNYAGAGFAVLRVYLDELRGARQGN
ncbi:MAG: hypothetical protein J7507_12135 [Pseudoxanthomonas sp.]|nr:hypothetical protein [Pseudoxanthomonas sp.]